MRRVVKRGQQKNRPPGRGIRRTILCWGQRSRTGKVRGVTPLQGMGEEKRGEVIWLDASVVGIGNRRDSGYDRKKLTDERLAERLAGREGRVIGRFVADHAVARELDTERDNYMSAQQAKEYGLIDEVITHR